VNTLKTFKYPTSARAIEQILDKLTPVLEAELVKILPQHVVKFLPAALSKLHLSLQDVANLTGVSYQRIHQLQQEGLLKAHGSPARVNLGDLFSFLSDREEKAQELKEPSRLKVTKTDNGEVWEILPPRPVRRVQ